MVVADLAIDKDHTVSIYCEHDQTAKVEAMFTPPQHIWVGLTDEELGILHRISINTDEKGWGFLNHKRFAENIEATLKEKNT